jgi:hypothetical protein
MFGDRLNVILPVVQLVPVAASVPITLAVQSMNESESAVACSFIRKLLRSQIRSWLMEWTGMYQGRNFGWGNCNFGLGAIKGPFTSIIGGELPTQIYLINV